MVLNKYFNYDNSPVNDCLKRGMNRQYLFVWPGCCVLYFIRRCGTLFSFGGIAVVIEPPTRSHWIIFDAIV